MSTTQRRAGIIQLNVGGVLYDAKGNFSYNLGREKREAIIGSDGVHGYSAKPQVAFIEGEITDRGTLDVSALVTMDGVTVTLAVTNGKTIALNNAWFAAEGTVQTEEANIGIRFEAIQGEEISS